VNREWYSHRQQEVSLNVVQTEIDSVRKKDVQKTGVRVYDQGQIGVAGAIGGYDAGTLAQKATDALRLGIAYPYELSADRTERVELESELPQGTALVSEMEEMLAALKSAQPHFSFANRISVNTREISLRNDCGLDLGYRGTRINLWLTIKDKSSANIFDAEIGYDGWVYDRAEFLRLANQVCDAYQRPADVDEGTQPVFFLTSDYTYQSKLLESLHGLLYATGGSLFSGKLGEKLFDERVNVALTRHPEDEVFGPFFDVEGTVSAGYRADLIRDGVLVAPMTDKRHASKYDLPLTGAAGGDYDSVPTIGQSPTRIAPTGQTIAELLGGQPGILVWMAMGGDFTPDGHFATPVQLAFLHDGEKLVGRLPELNLSSHLYDMLGKDLIGVSTDSLTSLTKMNLIGMNMQVSKSS
jgi:PmbA protein